MPDSVKYCLIKMINLFGLDWKSQIKSIIIQIFYFMYQILRKQGKMTKNAQSDLILTLRNLTFLVAFNKTVIASEATWLRKAGQVSQPTTLFKSKLRSILRFGTLQLKFLIISVNILNLCRSSKQSLMVHPSYKVH